jgi:hypothetical protein
MITIDGITVASIKIPKYLFIVAVNFEAFEILSPRINEEVPVKKFCVADVATLASVPSLAARAAGIWRKTNAVRASITGNDKGLKRMHPMPLHFDSQRLATDHITLP